MWDDNDKKLDSYDFGKYNDIYTPIKDKHNNNKRILIRNLLVFLLIIIILILVLFFIIRFVNNKKSGKSIIENIYIKGEKISPEFDEKIYDYYVLTEKDEIEIKCNINKKNIDISGCNKKINMNNKTYYIHQIIISNGTIYRINIKKKEIKEEELISINSITGIDKKSNSAITMKVNATSKSGDLTYSIDNGLTYQTSNEFLIQENKKIYLIVQDKYGNTTPVREINVNSIDTSIPTAEIEITNSSKESVLITAFGKDNDENLLYSFDNKEFTSINSYKVKKPHDVIIYVKDSTNNISSKYIFHVDDKDFISKTKYVAKYHSNGTLLDEDYSICTLENGTCIITTPNITREGYEILGWSKNKNSHNPEYKIGEEITLNNDIDLYAITKKEVSVTFDYNGIISKKDIKKCNTYNEEMCFIEVPDFKYEKGKIIGWNLYNNSESVLLSSNNKYYTNEDITLYALAYKTLDLSFDKNGSDYISSSKMKCKVINNNEGCYINLPIIKKEDSEILGWSTNPNNTNPEYSIDNKSLIKESIKLYAITKNHVEIEFNKNGSDYISNSKLSCDFYNKDKNCTITTPTIKRNGANIIGWNVDKTSHESIYKQEETISVNKNNTYYAITQIPVNVSFEKNGSSNVSFISNSCNYYNEEKGCLISTPNIIRNGWNIIGFSRSKNSKESEINANTSSLISKSGTYYAITSKSVTAYFNKYNADSLFGCATKDSNGCHEKCTYYNTSYSCRVKVPYMISKGNEVQFFSPSKDNISLGGFTPGSYINISSDITYYAIVKNYYRKKTYSITKTNMYGNVPFEVEAGCSSNIYNNYLNFVDRLYNKSPYIFGAGKVTFSGKSTFESTWGSGSAGMTYGKVVGYRNVDIICPTKFDRYYLKTIVHELTHAWDSYYKSQYGTYLNAMPDILALYNKYSKKSSSNRPLRDYSYSSKFEFVADMYSWYYFLYIDSTYMPTVVSDKPYYPNDMKTVMDKYIRIAKNGYK